LVPLSPGHPPLPQQTHYHGKPLNFVVPITTGFTVGKFPLSLSTWDRSMSHKFTKPSNAKLISKRIILFGKHTLNSVSCVLFVPFWRSCVRCHRWTCPGKFMLSTSNSLETNTTTEGHGQLATGVKLRGIQLNDCISEAQVKAS